LHAHIPLDHDESGSGTRLHQLERVHDLAGRRIDSAVARAMPAVNRSIFEWLRPSSMGSRDPRFLNLYVDAMWASEILIFDINRL
jgi:hypothetical protein